jgi:hypothetical protein
MEYPHETNNGTGPWRWFRSGKVQRAGLTEHCKCFCSVFFPFFFSASLVVVFCKKKKKRKIKKRLDANGRLVKARDLFGKMRTVAGMDAYGEDGHKSIRKNLQYTIHTV